MADERQLDSLVRLIGPEAVERFVEFRTAAREWRASLTAVARDSTRDEPTPYLLAAAEGLDTYLTSVSEATRARIRVYERAEVVSAMILFPLALAAIGIVFWSSHRLAGLVRAVEKERVALARSMEARTALIHGVTHDVKNPLGAAKGYAELLEEGIGGPLSSEQISMLRRVRRLVDVALGTVAELLDVARSDAGQLKLDRSAVDIGKIAEELVVDYHGTAAEKRIELKLVPLDDAIVVETDALRVRRILGNLLSNALKYTPSGGHVDVSVRRGERVEVTVQDSGPGVAVEDRERIFDEFFRAPGMEGVTSGAGLGLAISRRFARALGGDIVLDGAAAEGARFTLWLPADPGGESRASG
jgi:signal transduction histidine kinase